MSITILVLERYREPAFLVRGVWNAVVYFRMVLGKEGVMLKGRKVLIGCEGNVGQIRSDQILE